MGLTIQSIKGTQDVLPAESHKIQFLESTAREIAANYGFREIRTPVFEQGKIVHVFVSKSYFSHSQSFPPMQYIAFS